MHTYFFIIKFDDESGKGWTSRESVEANSKQEAIDKVIPQWIEYAKSELKCNPTNVKATIK
jgi:hypothetical protein